VIEYAVDSNVFIEAKNRYYRFDLPPGRWFWQLIDQAIDAGIVHSAERMREELEPARDDLTRWAAKHGDSLWIPLSETILNKAKQLVAWAQERVDLGRTGLYQLAVDEFADGDVFLIATAAASGLTVVTHETSAPLSRKRIMIPDACVAVGVSCVDPWTMLEDLHNRLEA